MKFNSIIVTISLIFSCFLASRNDGNICIFLYDINDLVSSSSEFCITLSKKEENTTKLGKVSVKKKKKVTGYIYIGDSRFVGMNNVCKVSKEKNTFVVAKVGQGYKWFTDTALGEVNKIKSSNKNINNWVLVIGLGVNDLGNCDKYVKKYKSLSKTNNIVLVSVNPIEKHKYITNKDISDFNTKLKSIDKIKYIDTYSYLVSNSYSTTDGLHYTNSTYNSIFKYIKKNLNN